MFSLVVKARRLSRETRSSSSPAGPTTLPLWTGIEGRRDFCYQCRGKFRIHCPASNHPLCRAAPQTVMRTSLIISTYNSPEYLRRALWSVAVQSDLPDEVIVADDGSDERTVELLIELAPVVPGLRHVWQEDLGFRKCRILNRAVVAARGDYLVFTDGDCVLRDDFVATHKQLAEAGRFLSGGKIRIPQTSLSDVTNRAISDQLVFSPRWLSRSTGVGRELLRVRFAAFGRMSSYVDAITPRSTFNGHNASVWKADLLRVNGFDERMQYGGLDRELGERLERVCVRGKQARHRAVCLHLEHPRPYREPEIIAWNLALRRHNRRLGRTWTLYGIVQDHADHPVAGVVSQEPPRFEKSA